MWKAVDFSCTDDNDFPQKCYFHLSGVRKLRKNKRRKKKEKEGANILR